jgi:hypothetical protein
LNRFFLTFVAGRALQSSGSVYTNQFSPQVFDEMKGLPINPFEIPIDPLTGRKRPYIEMVAEGHITPTAGTKITRSHQRVTPSEAAQPSPFQTLD